MISRRLFTNRKWTVYVYLIILRDFKDPALHNIIIFFTKLYIYLESSVLVNAYSVTISCQDASGNQQRCRPWG
jgi:hypothetical protein